MKVWNLISSWLNNLCIDYCWYWTEIYKIKVFCFKSHFCVVVCETSVYYIAIRVHSFMKRCWHYFTSRLMKIISFHSLSQNPNGSKLLKIVSFRFVHLSHQSVGRKDEWKMWITAKFLKSVTTVTCQML